MNSAKNEATISSSGNSIWQNERFRRAVLYTAILVVVFLVGFIPMWLRSRTYARERDAAQAALQVSNLQNLLANSAIDARKGDYEPARQSASNFFTTLGTEIARGRDSVFNEAQRNALSTMFASRDDLITLLARSDSTSADKLVDLYTKYRQATTTAPPR